MRLVLLLAIAGALGTVARYGVNLLTARWLGPGVIWGTLTVNLTGSFLVGFVWALAMGRSWSSPTTLAVTVGFLGAYTTFSALEWEVLRLIQKGTVWQGLAYALGSLVAGFAAVVAGAATGRAVA